MSESPEDEISIFSGSVGNNDWKCWGNTITNDKSVSFSSKLLDPLTLLSCMVVSKYTIFDPLLPG